MTKNIPFAITNPDLTYLGKLKSGIISNIKLPKVDKDHFKFLVKIDVSPRVRGVKIFLNNKKITPGYLDDPFIAKPNDIVGIIISADRAEMVSLSLYKINKK